MIEKTATVARFKNEKIPENIGGFKVTEPVAMGGMAAIYKGQDSSGNLEVAIKLISKEHSDAYDRRDKVNRDVWPAYKYLKGIRWEGELLLNLNHPHIIHAYEIGKENGQYYIVMEYLPPRSLHELSYARSNKLKGRRLKVVYQFAHALLHTHRSGVIHRDICPRNVLLDDFGRAILIDFGLSIPKLEKLQDVFYRSGTPSYMAPEVVRSGHYDFQTDIYAFGISMYEIFTGQPPFVGADEFERAQKNLNTPVIPPHEVNAEVPEELSAIIMKALEKDPAQRYPSMENVVQDLTRLLRKLNPSPTDTTRFLMNDDTRRMHERIRECCYMRYTVKSWVSRQPSEVAVTENISGGGISFRVREPLEIGTNLQLEIHPRAATHRIEATGKVVHVGDRDEDGLTKIGVEFIKIPRKDRDRFQKYVQERQSASTGLNKA